MTTNRKGLINKKNQLIGIQVSRYPVVVPLYDSLNFNIFVTIYKYKFSISKFLIFY